MAKQKTRGKTKRAAPKRKASAKSKRSAAAKPAKATAKRKPRPKPKKGPLARLADGFGALVARVTGKKPSKPAPPPARDRTIELSMSDVLSERTAPPPPPKS